MAQTQIMLEALISYIDDNKRDTAKEPKAIIMGIETSPYVEQGKIKGV